MKAFIVIIFLIIGGMVYFLLSGSPQEDVEDFLVQDDAIFEEFDEKVPTYDEPEIKKARPTIKREIAEVAKVKEEEGEIKLQLIEVINRQLFGEILSGDKATGSIVVFNDQIQVLNLDLKPSNGPPISVDYSAINLNPGGSFIVELEEGMISGLLVESGKGKYLLRFATGPLAGSAIRFAKEKSIEEKYAMEHAAILQAHALAQRQEANEMNEPSYEEEAQMNADEGSEFMPAETVEMDEQMDVASHHTEISEYDMEEKAEESGYTF